jgi:hypothetical protein
MGKLLSQGKNAINCGIMNRHDATVERKAFSHIV